MHVLNILWVVFGIGLMLGLAIFYEVAFIMLAPLVIVIAAEAKIPFLKLAIPAVVAATTAHSLFPPQPGPVALVNAYGADMGMVYIYGVLVTIPGVICAGLILPRMPVLNASWRSGQRSWPFSRMAATYFAKRLK